MHSQDPITKLTQTLQRDDGSQVRIVAQRGYGSGLTASLDVYVLRLGFSVLGIKTLPSVTAAVTRTSSALSWLAGAPLALLRRGL
ncbi:hypothetical protein H0O94_18665, partial [Escherichia coli]|nr:hypothetical protein [Escherichia coli]